MTVLLQLVIKTEDCLCKLLALVLRQSLIHSSYFFNAFIQKWKLKIAAYNRLWVEEEVAGKVVKMIAICSYRG